jgi:RNA-binding protein YhbY
MTALDNLHTFAVTKMPDGTAVVEIFRRIELHELLKVSAFMIYDKASDFSAISEKLCQSLDLELASRVRDKSAV